MPRLRDIGHDMREIFPRSGFGECRRVFILCLETSSTDVEQTLMLISGSGESLSLRAHKIETGIWHYFRVAAGLLFSATDPDGNRVDPRNHSRSYSYVADECSDILRAEPSVRHGLLVQDACLSSQRLGTGYVPRSFSGPNPAPERSEGTPLIQTYSQL